MSSATISEPMTFDLWFERVGSMHTDPAQCARMAWNNRESQIAAWREIGKHMIAGTETSNALNLARAMLERDAA